jgi:hypothetical protein
VVARVRLADGVEMFGARISWRVSVASLVPESASRCAGGWPRLDTAYRRFLDDDVRIGATDAERAETGAARQRRGAPADSRHRPRPLGERALYVERPRRKRNVRARLRRRQRRQSLAVAN